ncbi:MAG: response regulator transcription factor [Chloroflexi bacterium]|nr:response regulator transcription factor [Chloroflexota bacterium]
MNENSGQVRVALVDDHSIVRRGLRAYLNAQPDICVVGEAASGEEALAQAALWRADVVVMDAHMPGGITGIETTRRIKRACPEAQVIMLSGYADDARVIGALRAGAITYLPKDSEPEQLLEAVRQAAAGKALLDPELMKRVMEAQGLRYADVLTARELDVLRGVAGGLTNAEIASELHVSEETVKTHLSNILRKLNLTHRTQAAVFALKNGLVE